MNTEVTSEMLAKLPRWAQEHINRLTFQRNDAVKALNAHLEQQAPSAIYYDRWVSTGEKASPVLKRFRVSAERIVADCHGVLLTVAVKPQTESARWPGIELRWMPTGELMNDHVAFIPTGFQQAQLIAYENMRVTATRGKKPLG